MAVKPIKLVALSKFCHFICSSLVKFFFSCYSSRFCLTKTESSYLYFSFHCTFDSPNKPHLATAVDDSKSSNSPLVQCTSHMCPVRVHWHVKLNYKEYWRVKVTITNFNYRMNYTQWNLVAQHPNFDNLTQLFSFNYRSLTPYSGLSKFSFNQ